MKAALYHEFEKPLVIETVKDPACPVDGIVLETRANGVCRSDWHGWMGHDPMIKLPHVPGHEMSGVVLETGKEVKKVVTRIFATTITNQVFQAGVRLHNSSPFQEPM
jgi:alcohol dehydrogenase